MNKQIRQTFMVGITFVVAIGLILGFMIWLKGLLNSDIHISAIFDDARGIQAGQDVQMAGVNIGQVALVGLTPDNRARLELTIHKKNAIPVGSAFGIKTGLLAGQTPLTITPSDNTTYLKDHDVVQGVSADPFNDVLGQAPKTMAKVQDLLGESQKLVVKMQKTVDMLTSPTRQAKLDATLSNIQEATANIPVLERQVQSELATVSYQTNQLLASMQGTKNNADQLIGGAAKLTGNLNSAVTENRATIRSLLRSADDAASAVAGLTDQLKTTIGDPKLKQNLTTTADNLASISSRMDTIAGDIERLASDPRMSSDIRATVTNLRDTSASVRNLAARVEGIHLPGEKRKRAPETETPAAPPHPFSAASLLDPGLVFDSVYDTKVERLRFDTNYTLVTGKPGAFYRLGLFDATYGNRLNLQMGQGLNRNTAAYRYGIFAGTLGLGLDLRTGPLDLRFDLFDPNRATINARARTFLNPNTAITAGVDSLGNGNRATIGIQIRK